MMNFSGCRHGSFTDLEARQEIMHVRGLLARACKSITNRGLRQLLEEFDVELCALGDQRVLGWGSIFEEDLAGK